MKRVLTDRLEIIAFGDSYAAHGYLYPDGKVLLLKGTTISPRATNSVRERTIALRDEILRKKAVGTRLLSDMWFENHSEAASVLTGNMRSGYEVFKTLDNIPLGEFMEVEGFGLKRPETPQTHLSEGKAVEVAQTQYERNREARAACIAHYGARCAICGFDFGKTYGDDFEGIIQVHHIVPISEIGEEHPVDPVKDLIPVCPNCHVALHSKTDGVYQPEELRAMINKRKREKN